ncbi:hypothetical protein F2P81_005245 [Scophthalmus maximus]|uniref:Dual specificity protein phosphatase 22-B-like n=1 Tax=Scophthalmus maximus TaxID=52904 RepID=A0A6A4T6R1_SCOMX|nr:hypothetical protein F2P81_005245 [Scophthalmus maximus]
MVPERGRTESLRSAVEMYSHKRVSLINDMMYLCISAADHPKQNLIQYFRDSITFIHESRLKGEGCLVHCVAGVSRSVTLVVAYIMTVTGRGWVESLAAVRAARPCAGPNLGFLRQLEEFENAELTEIPEAPRYVTDLIPYSAPEVTKVILTTTPVSQSPLFFLH